MFTVKISININLYEGLRLLKLIIICFGCRYFLWFYPIFVLSNKQKTFAIYFCLRLWLTDGTCRPETLVSLKNTHTQIYVILIGKKYFHSELIDVFSEKDDYLSSKRIVIYILYL